MSKRLSSTFSPIVRKLFIAALGVLSLIQPSSSFADNANGKTLYLQRCAMCHGTDLKATDRKSVV